uniref:Protein kinase domain-containing protein n=1 Tax=Ditylenchus dipsaci TaxID=166011 RepID=A0A915E9T9_9BILA
MQSLFPATSVNATRSYSLINCNTVEYALPAEYSFCDYLGGGNYGNVIKVKTADGVELAVKKIFADLYTPDIDFRSFKNVYIVTSYAGVSLKQVLDKQKTAASSQYLHSANVIHRDLKPSNLAITEECDLTVLDLVSTNGDNLTAYVISRWYRSPEVIYWNNVSYSAKADVWSVGCILAELLTGKVLFPGSEAMEQYRLIIRLCGSPGEELMAKIEQQNSPAMRMVIERMGGIKEAIDLLDKILVMDPDRRISVEEALQNVVKPGAFLEKSKDMNPEETNLKPGFYTVELNRTVWIIPEMYQNLNPVGTGAYGTVCAAECIQPGEKVAIKNLLVHSKVQSTPREPTENCVYFG